MCWICLIVLLLLLVGLPVAWLVSEFKSQRLWVRCVLGSLAILCCFVITWPAVRLISVFEYNAWYGSASHELIEAAISGIEAGQTDVVLKELKHLREQFEPTYENRGRYDRLVEAAVQNMTVARATSP